MTLTLVPSGTHSRTAFSYFEPSQIPPPKIPRPFALDESSTLQPISNVDVLGRDFAESPCIVPLVPGIVDGSCSLAVLFYEIMVHNTRPERVWGSDADLYILKRLYARLKDLEQNLPSRFLVEQNYTPSTCFLR